MIVRGRGGGGGGFPNTARKLAAIMQFARLAYSVPAVNIIMFCLSYRYHCTFFKFDS